MIASRYSLILLLGAFAVVLAGFPDHPTRGPLCATFSICAYDPEKKEWGVAVASRVLAVGSVVPSAQAEVGAVATQSYANVTYGPRGLKMLADGKSAQEVLDALTADDKQRDLRQAAVVDAKGAVAHFTGKSCIVWAGAKSGNHYTCQGNMLAGPAVVGDMAQAFETAQGPLAWRLMAAMEAGEKAGGDKRGKQSAAILVVRKNAGYGGLDDRMIDLRVDDHTEPIEELGRILGLKVRRVK